MTDETAPAIVLTDPKPLPRDKRAQNCPQCGAGKDKRVASGGFGTPHPVCSGCGYEWHEERWNA